MLSGSTSGTEGACTPTIYYARREERENPEARSRAIYISEGSRESRARANTLLFEEVADCRRRDTRAHLLGVYVVL